MLVLAVQDRDVGPAERPVGAGQRLDGIDDGDGLVLRPGAGQDLDRGAVGAVGDEPLVGLEPRVVVGDQPVGGGQHVPDRAEVLLDPEAWRRTGRRGVGIVRRRATEPRVELGEGREAGAPEAVDRLVVVADDHDVVGPVRRPTEQLDQLDLGDVGVLELVDEEVAILALPAAQDVGPRLEQPRDGGDLLAEVERAAARELVLVGAIDPGELGQAEDLEGGTVDDVAGGEGVDARVLVAVDLAPVDGPAGAGDGPTGFAIGDLVGGVRIVVCVSRPRLRLVRRRGRRRRHLGQPGAARGCPARRACRTRLRSCRSAPRRRARSLGDVGVEVVGR